MKRRKFLRTTGIGVSSLALNSLCNLNCGIGEKRPNILFIFTDDQRFNTINALNNPEVRTPNMDRLVKSGISFVRAHIMGGTSGAVCMPSRAMLMSGKNLFHLKNRGAIIPEGHLMLPEYLRRHGYQTFATGKWHNGREAYARSFTAGGKIMFGGMSDHLKVPVYDFDPGGEYPKEMQYTGEKFSSEMFSDEAIQFIEHHRSDDPFFVYISYTAPHDPRMAPIEFTEMYDPEKISLPPNFLPRHPFDNGEMFVRDEMLAPFPRTPEIVKEHIAAYYAMITHLDFHIGRVLDALERSGKAENTIIVFAGDNGLAVGQHGLLGKQNLYDHSVRVPLIFCGPGIPEDKRAETLCYIHDIFPTLCDLLNLKIPDSVESKSLMPALKNQSEKIRDSLFLAYTKLQRGVRTDDDWKLIQYNVRGKQTSQLFNLNDDPWELNNLSEDENYKSRKNDLIMLLKNYMQQLDDFCDLDKPNWGLPEEKITVSKVSHLAKGKKVISQNRTPVKYSTEGLLALTDGLRASSSFNDGHWVGIEGDDLDVVIDLGRIRRLSKITIGCLQNQNSWIFLPKSATVSTSVDGRTFSTPHQKNFGEPQSQELSQIENYSFTMNEQARYLRVLIENVGLCPKWHQGFGGKAWVFVDEIIVE